MWWFVAAQCIIFKLGLEIVLVRCQIGGQNRVRKAAGIVKAEQTSILLKIQITDIKVFS